jgi:glycosyltransferase involved in cell wall biosynthesis
VTSNGARADIPSARVLHIGLGGVDAEGGGSARYLRELVDALVALGVPARSVVVDDAGASLPIRLRSVVRACSSETPAPDVVDVHFPLYGVLPVRFGRLRRVPTVAHFHGPWAEEAVAAGRAGRLGARVRRGVERAVLRHAAAVIVLSGAFGAEVVQRYGVSPWQVHIVPPGVDAERFAPADRDAARARFDLGPSDFVAASVRRLVPRTGVDVLVDAWAAVGDHGAALLVAGDGPEAARLREQASRTGATGVQFLGRVGDDVLADVYRAADVSVVPSRAWEGFGLVVLESLACGTPVLVSDEGGLPEAVLGLDPGLVVPPADPNALRARLERARRELDALPTRDACRAFATTFAWPDVARRHRDLYRNITSPARTRPLRVLSLDHCARLSGGEIALARVLGALHDVDVHVVLFERGPLTAWLGARGITHEVVPLAARAGGLGRDRVRPTVDAVLAAALAAGHTLRLARRIRRLRPDVVHTNSLKAGVIGGLAAKLARVPVVWHQRELVSDTRMPRTARRALRWLVGAVPDAVVVNSEATRRSLQGSRSDSTATFVVPDCVDGRATPATESPRAGTQSLTFGVVGRLAPQKGQREFLVAFATAFADDPSIHARVVGAALFGEDDYAASLRALAVDLGIASRVEFVGFVPDVGPELARLDVLVVPSLVPEGFGLTVVEGMAAGLPVIAPDAGGPAELISDDVDGVLVPPRDTAALASALRHLAADPDERHRLGEAARGRAADFTPERAAACLAEALRAAAKERVAS